MAGGTKCDQVSEVCHVHCVDPECVEDVICVFGAPNVVHEGEIREVLVPLEVPERDSDIPPKEPRMTTQTHFGRVAEVGAGSELLEISGCQ